MRLTLRTLLAYMDGNLDPQDAQEIGKKIEDSQFASELFHKIRDVMRRLRLAAPSVTERGANLDCNTVAEYLDNILPADRVPEFEEDCLKSEMHLAEVAAAHQILTIVQVEPIEINPDSRQRMYQLPTVAGRVDEERQAAAEAASALSGDGAAAPAPTAAAAPVKVRPRPVVPDYLRDPPKKRRLLPVAAITLLLGAVVGLVLVVTGQFNPNTPLGDGLAWLQAKFGGKPVALIDRDANAQSKPADSGKDAKTSGNAATTSESAPSGAGPKPGGVPPVNSGQATPVEPSRGSAAGPVAPLVPSEPAGIPELVPPNAAAGKPAPETPATPPLPTKDTGVAGRAPPAAGTGRPIVPAEPPRTEIQNVPPDGMAIPPAADNRPKIAKFTSDGQDVLLKFDAASTVWRRVLPEEFLTANQRLLALPCYRSRIDVFDVGATIELLNGARVELLQGGPQGPLGVAVDFGRIIVKPLAQAGARVRVVVGPHSGVLTLANVESIAAFEVTRVHEPGTDPEKVLSHALTKLYVARGGASWQEAGKPPVQLAAPGLYLLDGAGGSPSGAAAVDAPKWITANTINELEQRAAVSVSQSPALSGDRSASLGLMELAEARQKEVRNLAARALGYLGQFDPLTAALDDPDARGSWPDYVDELKEAIARGPETAAAIRQSLEKRFGDNAKELKRMLCGYTNRNLEGGDDARLVSDLDHEALIFRVLAFSNLKEITGRTFSYRPEFPAAKRLTPVQRWKQELERSGIRWPTVEPRRTPPQPLSVPDNPPGESNVPGEATTDVRPTSAVEPMDAMRARLGTSMEAASDNVPQPPPSPRRVPQPVRPKTVVPEPSPNDRP